MGTTLGDDFYTTFPSGILDVGPLSPIGTL